MLFAQADLGGTSRLVPNGAGPYFKMPASGMLLRKKNMGFAGDTPMVYSKTMFGIARLLLPWPAESCSQTRSAIPR